MTDVMFPLGLGDKVRGQFGSVLNWTQSSVLNLAQKSSRNKKDLAKL